MWWQSGGDAMRKAKHSHLSLAARGEGDVDESAVLRGVSSPQAREIDIAGSKRRQRRARSGYTEVDGGSQLTYWIRFSAKASAGTLSRADNLSLTRSALGRLLLLLLLHLRSLESARYSGRSRGRREREGDGEKSVCSIESIDRFRWLNVSPPPLRPTYALPRFSMHSGS